MAHLSGKGFGGGSVRQARLSDVSSILRFVRELADCQNELSDITTTEEKLRKTIAFDPEDSDTGSSIKGAAPITPFRPARCLLALNELGLPVGMALYFYSYVTWHAAPGIYLEDLYVLPEERRGGHGKRLMQALWEELQAVGGARIEWRAMESNEPGLRFYKSLGATTMDGWKDMKWESNTIAESENRTI